VGDGPPEIEPWFWEGNVQAAVVSDLAANGWRIRRVANTATSEHGVDIEADRSGERLLIEVKGYPGATTLEVHATAT
jgi:Holliday junction resolvase